MNFGVSPPESRVNGVRLKPATGSLVPEPCEPTGVLLAAAFGTSSATGDRPPVCRRLQVASRPRCARAEDKSAVTGSVRSAAGSPAEALA